MNLHAQVSRRDFLQRSGLGLGGIALTSLLQRDASAAEQSKLLRGVLDQPHFAPKAKRVISLVMSGGPSQLDLFDYKPLLNTMHGQELPDSVRKGQRLTGMSGFQSSLPLAGSAFKFAQNGKSGSWLCELLPWTGKMADELCF